MKRQYGFTLVEMAIVVTIIGLIIGGISLASNLIRNARVNAIPSEAQQYIQAMKLFQDKYLALPGDYSSASTAWSLSNGDGDGTIGVAESFYAWTHLAAAGMIEGKYSGSAGSLGSYDRIPGINVPASQLTGAGWGMIFIAPSTVTNAHIQYTPGEPLPNHVLWFGGRSTSGTSNLMGYVLVPDEAEQIDNKLDDGLPITGKILAQNEPGGGGAPLSSCSSTTVYRVDVRGQQCALVFKTGF